MCLGIYFSTIVRWNTVLWTSRDLLYQDIMAADPTNKKDELVPSLSDKLANTPCYRSSLLTGIGSGVGIGLGYFMATSKVRAATNVAMASYVSATLVAWVWCRYKWSSSQVDEVMVRRALQKKILMEGTKEEDLFKQHTKDVWGDTVTSVICHSNGDKVTRDHTSSPIWIHWQQYGHCSLKALREQWL